MKITSSLLAGSILASMISLSAFARVNDGSNASRAPMPSQLPMDYSQAATVGSPGKFSIVANHIGSPVSTRQVAVVTPIQTRAPLALSPVTLDTTRLVAAAK